VTAFSIARFILALVLLASLDARADAGAVVVGGSASERDRGSVKLAIEAAVRAAGWTLHPEVPKRDADALLGCKDVRSPWTCVPASLGNVLVAYVDSRRSDTGAPMIVITGQLIASDVRVAATGSQYCEQCATDKLATSSTELARQLLRDLSVRAGRTLLDVRSSPVGAEVSVDGKPVGVTDGTFNTFPGAHTVIVQKPGYQREVREVVVGEGKTAAVSFALVPATTVARPYDKDRARVVPAIVAGAGLGMIVGGTIVSLNRDVPDTGPQPKYIYDGTAITIGVVGVGVLAAGCYLWYRAGKRRSSPNLSIIPGGATAAWVASF
jgi:hypothetical protein